MLNWNEGYMSQINYTTGYYRELSPNQCVIPFLMANLAPPSTILNAKYNACELGFGMGLSLNIHAAAVNAKWYATDFNPSHALFAQHLAEGTDPNKLLIADQAFQEFCQRDDLPEFDFIGLHGIFSWISDSNKQIIVDFIKRKLKVGGVLYISYNCLPGWSAHASLRHLLHHFYQIDDTQTNNVSEKVNSVITQVEALLSHSPSLLSQVPYIREHLNKIKQQNPQYVVHEFFNQHWQPMYFSEMAQILSEAKLEFACSSNYLDDCDLVLFSDEQKAYLANISDPILHQTAKDFILNTTFRRDFWVKGKRQLSFEQQEQIWRNLRIMLTKPREAVEQTIARKLSITLNPAYLNGLLDILQDHQAHSVDSIIEKLGTLLSKPTLFQLLALLNARSDIELVLPEENTRQCQSECDSLNLKILAQLFSSTQMNVLASPVTGAGVMLDDVELLFIDAHRRAIPTEKLEEEALTILTQANKLLVKNNQVLENVEETTQELSKRKEHFINNTKPILTSLGIISV